jgi:hypothetical protein
MVKKIVVVSLMIFTINSYAGLYGLTIHSRANCLNNESITWWYGHPHFWKVVSIHKHNPTGQMHLIDTGWVYSDRVAAVHWGEGVHGGYAVWGYHYFNTYNSMGPTETTFAEGCEIIDGWI